MDGLSTLAARPAPAPDCLVGRRISPRAQCEISVEVREGGDWYRAVLRDISLNGFRVVLRNSGRTCDSVWLRLPGIAPLPAKVCWREADLAGCQFLYPLDEKLQASIWTALGIGPTRRAVSI